MNPEATGPTRQPKTASLSEAVSRLVPDYVESLAVGGMHLHNNPMALVRELVRQNKHIKRLITGPAGSLNADLLIGAGLVEEVVTSYLGFEMFGLAPAYRRFAQAGRIKVYELDEFTLTLCLKAGASGQPFAVVPPGVEFSQIVEASPEFYKPTTDPFTGKTVLAAPALRPRVTLFVAQQADEFGNGLFKGSTFDDREMMLAGDTVIMQAEEVISNAQLTRNPLLVSVPGALVDAVVPSRFGCHPTSSHRFYNYDDKHLAEYLELAATEEGFQEYLQRYISGVSEEEYLKKTQISNM